MKVLMVLSNPFTHDPRVYIEAKTLIKAGYELTVLAWDKRGKSSPVENKDGIQSIEEIYKVSWSSGKIALTITLPIIGSGILVVIFLLERKKKFIRGILFNEK